MLRNVKVLELPLGTIIPYFNSNEPKGFLICDGRSCEGYEIDKKLGIKNTPDLRGKFTRMVGGNAAELGVTQEDCIRNITGSWNIDSYSSELAPGNTPPGTTLGNGMKNTSFGENSALYTVSNNYHNGTWSLMRGYDGQRTEDIMIDASRVVPTGPENRPVNVALNYIMYVGEKKLKYLLNIIRNKFIAPTLKVVINND